MSVLLAFLGRHWPVLLIGAAVIFVVYRIDQNGYERAKSEQARQALVNAVLIKRMEGRLLEQLAGIDRDLGATVANIDRLDRTVIQPALKKELGNDPRYSDPRCAVSDGVLRALNSARGADERSGAGRSN